MKDFKQFGKVESTNMKGVLVLLVFLHHAFQYGAILHRSAFFSFIFDSLGFLSVGSFLFISGYGNFLTSQRLIGGGKYLVRNRFVPIYAINLALLFVWLLLYYCYNLPVSGSEIASSLLLGKTLVPMGWYLQCYCIITLMYAASITINKEKQLVFMALFLCIYWICCFMFNMPSNWYVSVFPFLVGMYVAGTHKINNHIFSAIVVSLLILCISVCIYYTITMPIIRDFTKTLMAICFSINLYAFFKSYKFKFSFLKFMGERSLEMYLMQGIVFLLLKWNGLSFSNSLQFFIISLLLCLVLGIITHPVFVLIMDKAKTIYKYDNTK